MPPLPDPRRAELGSRPYRGRLAPSPTGALHLGVARTFLIAFLRARKAGGTLVMRIEDLDPPRVVDGAEQAILADLRWLGLSWDEGPDVGGPYGPYRQSECRERYARRLAELQAAGRVFACSCSRKDVLAAATAPHGDLGPQYPGTCRAGATRADRSLAIRFRMDGPTPGFADALCGTVPPEPGDDFIVRRSDHLHAYQLAVVADDAAMHITEVVRGDDLLTSTGRQLALYAALDVPAPRFLHVPLVLGADGRRLAKRHGGSSIREHRERGMRPEQVVGALAASLGLVPPGTEAHPDDLVTDFDLTVLASHPGELESGLR